MADLQQLKYNIYTYTPKSSTFSQSSSPTSSSTFSQSSSPTSSSTFSQSSSPTSSSTFSQSSTHSPNSPTFSRSSSSRYTSLVKVRPSSKLIYMDGMNFAYLLLGSKTQWYNLRKCTARIGKLVQASHRSGYTLEVFIDAVTLSDECIYKWRSRREEEILHGYRKCIPYGASIILGDIFRSKGIKVHYCTKSDCDDTIISYAYANKACILSRDKDFFQYNAIVDVYPKYTIDQGKMVLHAYSSPIKNIPSKKILTPLPITRPINDRFEEVVTTNKYIRGVASPLTKLESLHITVRPLRQALYSLLGVVNPVHEEFPIWDDGKVKWDITYVLPDDTLEYLLYDYTKAYEYFKGCIPSIDNTPYYLLYNHIYALKIVVAEIVAAATKSTLIKVLGNTLNFDTI